MRCALAEIAARRPNPPSPKMSVHGNTFRFRQNQRHLGGAETRGSALALGNCASTLRH